MTDITIKGPDGSFACYRALPKSGKGPGIVVIQEIFGVNGWVRGVADAFAAEGYVAYAPDLFWRQAPGIQLTDKTEQEWAKAFELYKGFDETKGVEDLRATIAALRADPACTGKVGAVGFCLGGKLAYLVATRTDIDASVGYYGVGIENALGEAASIKRPLLLHVAELDKFCPPEAQQKIAAALGAHPLVKIKTYAGRDHAFARDGGQHYHEKSARKAGRRTRDFFAKHLGLEAPKKPKPGRDTLRCMAQVVHAQGGPEVMKWEEVSVAPPGPGEALIRHTAIGLNYIDTYHRSGLYPMKTPFTPGMEGAGVVEAVGKGVKDLEPGDRVAYASGPVGAYVQWRTMPADRLVRIPKSISDEQAAAMMLQGMTVEYLLHRTYKVGKGDTILIHAAAGGVGLILCQWASWLGATVIGTVSTEEKAKLAKKHGCKHPILYTKEDLVARVKEITKGKGVPVVYDSIGKDTWTKSLDCLAPRGLMVSFGNASGPLPPINTGDLVSRGSLFFTRPTLMTYTAKRDDLEKSAKRLFKAVKSGAVKIRVNQTYALKDAVQAHKDLEGRKTTGSTIFTP
jgi:NADPH:quinone reductase